MSVRAISRVFAESKQTGSRLLMLVAIADRADDDGNAFPAVSTLAVKCRMTLRNAQLVLAALRASGELEVRQSEGPNGANRYRIVSPQGVQNLAGGVKPASGGEAGFRVKPDSGGDEAGFAKGVKPASPDTSLIRQERIARKRAAPDPEGFAEFWSTWPASSRKQDRKKCAEHWRRHNLAEHLPAVVAHVQAMKATRQWRDGYEPAPLTYLRGERWNDGPAPVDAVAAPGRALDCDEVFR